MRSSDSGMVNLKGWPAAWCGVWRGGGRHGRERHVQTRRGEGARCCPPQPGRRDQAGREARRGSPARPARHRPGALRTRYPPSRPSSAGGEANHSGSRSGPDPPAPATAVYPKAGRCRLLPADPRRGGTASPGPGAALGGEGGAARPAGGPPLTFPRPRSCPRNKRGRVRGGGASLSPAAPAGWMRVSSQEGTNLGGRPPPGGGAGGAPRRGSAGSGKAARTAQPPPRSPTDPAPPRPAERRPGPYLRGAGSAGTWLRPRRGSLAGRFSRRAPPPCPGFTPGVPRGPEWQHPPAAFPPPPRAGAGARRRSVPPPRGHPPAAASFVAVVPGRAGDARGRRPGRARDGRRRSALLRRRCGPRPHRTGAAGRYPTGRGGGGWAAAAPLLSAAGANNPPLGLASADAVVRPETPGGGDSSPRCCLLPRGENPAGGSGARCQRRDRRKPGGREKVSGGGRAAPGRRRRDQVIGKRRSDEQGRKAGGGGRGRGGALRSRPRSEQLQ